MRTFVCANSREELEDDDCPRALSLIFALIGQSKVSRQTPHVPNRRKSQLDVFPDPNLGSVLRGGFESKKGSDLERCWRWRRPGEPLAKLGLRCVGWLFAWNRHTPVQQLGSSPKVALGESGRTRLPCELVMVCKPDVVFAGETLVLYSRAVTQMCQPRFAQVLSGEPDL